MSIPGKYRLQFTGKDYLLWEGRWERFDGMRYGTPAPPPTQNGININLVFLFKTALAQNCKEFKVYISIDWKVDEKTVLQSGSLIAGQKKEKNYSTLLHAASNRIQRAS